jgi:hypothetical protein
MGRRSFLRRTAAAVGALSSPWALPSHLLAANQPVAPSERITVGIIGRGAMGSGHVHRLAYDSAFQVVAICDVDKERREAGRQTVEDIYAVHKPSGTYRGCRAYNDYREVLARDDIDAVLIATPDHWHTPQSIDAVKAGKDVYCEKPLTMTLHEGRRLAAAVNRYGRVLQTGTQYRSIPAVRKVCQFIRDGGLGKIKAVFTNYAPLSSFMGADRIQPYAKVMDWPRCGGSYAGLDFALPEETAPEGLDWELWVGPAPWRPYNRLYHINPSPGVVPWSFSDAFGVTASTWFMSHAVDVIQWALGFERYGPVEVVHPSSGRFPTMTCVYGDGTPLHLVENWEVVKKTYGAIDEKARLAGLFGGLFIGERGWLTTMSGGGQLEGSPESLFEEMGLKRGPEVGVGSNTHHANWLECIKSRQKPSADEEIGHRSASVGHLANIAMSLGRSLKWDPVKEVFPEDPGANRLLHRAYRAPWRF